MSSFQMDDHFFLLLPSFPQGLLYLPPDVSLLLLDICRLPWLPYLLPTHMYMDFQAAFSLILSLVLLTSWVSQLISSLSFKELLSSFPTLSLHHSIFPFKKYFSVGKFYTYLQQKEQYNHTQVHFALFQKIYLDRIVSFTSGPSSV